jgi:hypothetical protein
VVCAGTSSIDYRVFLIFLKAWRGEVPIVHWSPMQTLLFIIALFAVGDRKYREDTQLGFREAIPPSQTVTIFMDTFDESLF